MMNNNIHKIGRKAISYIHMANRQSSIVNCQSSIVNRQLSMVNRQSSIVNCQSSMVNRQLSIVNRQSSMVINVPCINNPLRLLHHQKLA